MQRGHDWKPARIAFMETGPKSERECCEQVIKSRKWMHESPSDIAFVTCVTGMRLGECWEEQERDE